jgi:hypothetical protein
MTSPARFVLSVTNASIFVHRLGSGLPQDASCRSTTGASCHAGHGSDSDWHAFEINAQGGLVFQRKGDNNAFKL